MFLFTVKAVQEMFFSNLALPHPPQKSNTEIAKGCHNSPKTAEDVEEFPKDYLHIKELYNKCVREMRV